MGTACRTTPLGRVRLADVEDAPSVLEIINDSMRRNFRITSSADIVYLIENCVLSICQLDVNDTIVGFLSVKDYPLIPSVHPSVWEEYIWTKYKSIELNSRNTLFLHLLCWSPEYSRELVDNMLRTMFMHDPYLNYICMVKSLIQYPLLVPGQSRSEAGFRRVNASEKGVSGDQLPTLCIAERAEICPRLRIRRAVEEDNDDIIPIIERHSTRLRELYGEFYVSELISRHPESERVLLVCEHKEIAVGVMCLNTQINFESLEENFELSPFAGLRHLASKPDINITYADISLARLGSNSNISQINFLTGNKVSYDKSVPQPKEPKVVWVDEGDTLHMTSRHGSLASLPMDDHMITVLDILDLLEDDADEVDFDIVNIDKNLLKNLHMSVENISRSRTSCSSGVLKDEKEKRVLDDSPFRSDSKRVYTNVIQKDRALSVPSPGLCSVQTDTVRYIGKPNAFLLELFAMHWDYDERYGFDMLQVAYELFPEREYCIMCIPSDHPSFPLLEHFTLVTPYQCHLRYVSDSLYVAHINSVRGSFLGRRDNAKDLYLSSDVRVRAAEPSDYNALSQVLEHAPRKQAIIELYESTFTSHLIESFVLLSQNTPIGLVITGPLEDNTSIRVQHNLEPEPRRTGTDGVILAGVTSPVLEPHVRWYVRDLLRHTRYTTLFWLSRLFAKGDAGPLRNLMSLTTFMQPVCPRRCQPKLTSNNELDVMVSESTVPFALWHIERPLTSLPKVNVNNSIVVVGASRTGLSFLETLIMGPTSKYLTFTNICLVSEHGLPTVAECIREADICVPRDGRYSDKYIKSIPFYFYVDVISSVMVSIDRRKKCIYLKGGSVKYYDELVLTCGRQFQHPDYLKESLELVKEVGKGMPCERILMDDPRYQPDRVPPPPELPENVMLINSLFDANYCLRKLLRMVNESKNDPNHRLSVNNPVVVYGDCVEAYSCIAALLELGLTPDAIVFVEPFPLEHPGAMRVNCFNNEIVDERVQSKIKLLGIKVYRKCRLASWKQPETRVISLQLMTDMHCYHQSCFVLFYYGTKGIDLNAFKAINESGLVYDGGLVVGPLFDTNDPHVYAAGTCTRYSRRLFADDHNHRHYCSEDVGESLAHLFLRKFDPFEMADVDAGNLSAEMLPAYAASSLLTCKSSRQSLDSVCDKALIRSKKWQPVIKFESPIVEAAVLPGPLYYMKMRKPGPEIPMEVMLTLPQQGHFLETDKRGNYFRLHINFLHCVEGVICLSGKQFSTDILSQLYGKHEAFFNKLLARYYMNQIPDFYKFFVQPWMNVLYQETFPDLVMAINQQDVGTVYDLVKSKFLLKDDIPWLRSKQVSAKSSNCLDIPSCGYGPKDAQNLGTFRSVIDKFIARTSSLHIVRVPNIYADSMSECGQSPVVCAEAASFWKTVGGENIAIAHLTKYLNRNAFINPNYSTPKPENT